MKEIEKAKCELGLADFVRAFWGIVEPATPLVWGWVLDAMCTHLEAVTRGEITRLTINVSPGFMKSLLVNVFWPAWEWGPKKKPHLRYVTVSYSNALTTRDNIRFRRIITCDKYTEFWGDVFGPSEEQFNVINSSNNKTGWKLATSIGGLGTGARGDRIIIDDGNSVLEAESEAVRLTTNTWVREVMPDRLNNMSTGAIVNIQQRTHQEDVTGVLLEMDVGYIQVCIPMEFEQDRKCITPFWEDPRTEEGELAWPERFPREVVDIMKKSKGVYAYNGQYQQNPTPRGGGIIWREWWKPYQGPLPKMEYIVASIDCAYTSKDENDYSALTIWGVWRNNYRPYLFLIDAWKIRQELNPLVKEVGKSCHQWNVDRLLVEDKASGHSVAQEIRRLFGSAQWATQLYTPRGDKVARVYSISHLFSEGLIYYAEDNEAAKMVIEEVAVFPKGKYDDLVDSVSMALRYLRDTGWALHVSEHQPILDRAMALPKEAEPLYDV